MAQDGLLLHKKRVECLGNMGDGSSRHSRGYHGYFVVKARVRPGQSYLKLARPNS